MIYCTTWHWLEDVKTRKHLRLHTLMLIIMLIFDLTYIRSFSSDSSILSFHYTRVSPEFFSLSKTTIWRMKTKIPITIIHYIYSVALFIQVVVSTLMLYIVNVIKCFCKTASWTVYLIIIFCHSPARFCICFLSISIFLFTP